MYCNFGKYIRTMGAVFLVCALIAGNLSVINGETVYAGEPKWDSYGQIIYNTTNGLLSNHVTCITQSVDGMIWIGTDSGLVSFDGNEFTDYASFYHFDGVTDSLLTHDGELWYSTITYGPCIDCGGRFQHFDNINENASNYSTALAESSDGYIYSGSIRGMIMLSPAEGFLQIDISENGIYGVCDLVGGADGNVVGTTFNGDVFMINKTEVKYIHPSVVAGNTAVEYVNGKYIVGTSDGRILVYDEGNFSQGVERTYSLPDSYGRVKSFYKDENRLWVLCEYSIGYYSFDGEPDVLGLDTTVFTPCYFDNFESGYTDMFVDYQGNYWISSDKRGVLFLKSSEFRNEFANISLNMDIVNAAYVYKDKLYCGTDSGMVVINRKEKAVLNSPVTDGLLGKRITDIVETTAGYAVAVYGEGIFFYDSDDVFLHSIDDELISPRINGLERIGDELYILTDEGVCVSDGNRVTKKYDSSFGMYNEKINCALKGAFGYGEKEKLYLGSDGAGIYVFEDGQLVEVIDENSGLPSRNIRGMVAYKKGFFVATDGGFCYYNGRKVVDINSLTDEVLSHATLDMQIMDNILYLVGEKSMYVLDIDTLFDREKATYKYFDEKTGFMSSFTPNGHCFLTEGELFIPCGRMVYSINGEFKQIDMDEYRLILRSVKANERNVEADSEMKYTVGSGTETLEIYCSAVGYSDYDPKLRYFLYGIDSEYQYVTQSTLKTIEYENLPGGTYLFQLELLDDDDEVADSLSFQIVKEYSFFEKLWVRMVALFTGFGILMYFVFKKRNQ